MNGENPALDFYFEKDQQWKKAFSLLRTIILSCGLEETLKWGQACYTFNGTNVVLIHGFKEYCALLFFKGALLKDTNGILIQQTKNVQAARQIRFTNANEITKLKATLKRYIYEAVAIEEAGIKVKLKAVAAFDMPEEFAQALKKNAALKKAFTALTPGRQRGYLLFFAQAKQSQTRVTRIEKNIPNILAGKGLND
ncbi:MAG: YdeI/OmpD-associated family protein [Bacteroidetes bacterium]|nr:YdeI/OmpD-associated family protein [Bacteroidota bacterium]